MGTWGTGISSNDTYADVYYQFFNLYNEGMNVREISNRLIETNQEIIHDPDDSNNFWFALAKAQWECKKLDRELFDRVKTIIETSSDLNVWLQLGATKKDIQKRKVVLEKFLSDLQTERPKAKLRKRKIIRQPAFERGDCLTFKLENGNYGGALVLEALKDSEYGFNLLVATRINQSTKPLKKDFETAEVLILNFANWDNRPVIKWYFSTQHKKIAHLIEKVDNIEEVLLNIDATNSNFSHIGDFELFIIQAVNSQFEHEQTNQKPIIRKMVHELTIGKPKSKWKLFDNIKRTNRKRN